MTRILFYCADNIQIIEIQKSRVFKRRLAQSGQYFFRDNFFININDMISLGAEESSHTVADSDNYLNTHKTKIVYQLAPSSRKNAHASKRSFCNSAGTALADAVSSCLKKA